MLKRNLYHDDLTKLVTAIIHEGAASRILETYLLTRSQLPGPALNLQLVRGLAYELGEVARESADAAAQVIALLDGWAALTLDDAPVNDPHELLVSAAALTCGQLAVVRPERWDAMLAKLHTLATDPRWRTRDQVAAAFQLMLAADWSRAHTTLMDWVVCDDEPLLMRAAVAAVAEPTLLTDDERKEGALGVQALAITQYMNLPDDVRQGVEARALRQALGDTLSVATAAYPEEGFALMQRIAALPDPDIVWIVRENMKHKRLSPFQDRLDTLETALFRPE